MFNVFKTLFQFVANNAAVISIVILTAITTLSLLPLPELPEVAGGDKLHHIMAYLCLAIPVTVKGEGRLLWFLLFYITWSGAIELIQPFVNRYGEWADLLANGVGLLLGAGIGLALRNQFIKST